jgi:hypothetical protein
MSRRIVQVLVCGVVALSLVGCGGLTYKVVKPVVSTLAYTGGPTGKITIKIVDKRAGDDTVFMKKIANLKNADITLEELGTPITFLAENLEKELNARNIPVSCITAADQKGDITLEVDRFQIINRRISGYSPWEAFHVLKGSVTNANGTFPVHAYFFNGKVPIWGMGEIEKPCINMPLSIMIKEIATKVNRLAIGAKASDDNVAALVKEVRANIDKENDGPFWKVLELGATNNPAAMDPLKEFAKDKDNFFKACVLSAIGNLGAQDQVAFLKQQLDVTSEVSKFMVLKSIGDVENQESKTFLENVKNSDSEDGINICKELYTK